MQKKSFLIGILLLISITSFTNCETEIKDSRLQDLFSNNYVTNFSSGSMTSIDEVYFDNNTFKQYRKLINTDGEENEFEHTYKIKIINKNRQGGVFYAISSSIPDEYFEDPLFRQEYNYTFNGNELILEWKSIKFNYTKGRSLNEDSLSLTTVYTEPVRITRWRNVEQVDSFRDPTGIIWLFGSFESSGNKLSISISDRHVSFTINDGRRDISLTDTYVGIRTSSETIGISTDSETYGNWLNVRGTSDNNSDSWTKSFIGADRVIYRNDFIKFLKENNDFRLLFRIVKTNNSASHIFNIDTTGFTELYNEMIENQRKNK
jgi:hypothetical protein